MRSMSALYSVSSGLFWLTSLGIAIAFGVVAFHVKRARPDAFGPLVGAAALMLVDVLVGRTLSMVIVSLGSMIGFEAQAMGNFAISMLRLLLDVASAAALLVGIVRLAKPAGTDPSRAFADGRFQ